MFGLRLGLGHRIRFLVIKVKGWLGLALGLRLGLGLGKLRCRTGGPGGLPPVLGFGLGKLRDPT